MQMFCSRENLESPGVKAPVVTKARLGSPERGALRAGEDPRVCPGLRETLETPDPLVLLESR